MHADLNKIEQMSLDAACLTFWKADGMKWDTKRLERIKSGKKSPRKWCGDYTLPSDNALFVE